MSEFSNIMRRAKIEQATQKVYCPKCDKSNFTVFRKDSLEEGKIYLHYARCNECDEHFVFKVNPQGEVFVD